MNSSGTVIGKGICIRGEITGAEDCFVDGMVEGAVTLDGKRLTVGADGMVQADIIAGDLVVFGRVEGSLKASACAELKHSAVFIGDIAAARLSVEDNATVQGYVDLTAAIEAPKKPAAEERVSPIMIEEAEPQFSHAV